MENLCRSLRPIQLPRWDINRHSGFIAKAPPEFPMTRCAAAEPTDPLETEIPITGPFL